MKPVKNILLIISGSIAAYRSLELIRILRKQENITLYPVLSKGGEHFVTPLSVEALTGNACLTSKDWQNMQHISLARKADLILVCPASANFIARMAAGLADELATSLILSAKNIPIYLAPAMNPEMWHNPATQDNIKRLTQRNIHLIPPEEGLVACGEYGTGRLATLESISEKILAHLGFSTAKKALSGKKAIVTAGPTREALDPVRFITNHSSGKQGYAIAQSLANAGAEVTLITGPTALNPPENVKIHKVVTACEMALAVMQALPADIFVGTAAVADWRPEFHPEKIKKTENSGFQNLKWHPNPDILKNLGHSSQRPSLLIGFAAETCSVKENAQEKRLRKKCDWILANNIKEGVFNSDFNTVSLLSADGIEDWPSGSKKEIADKLTAKITAFFSKS